MSEDYWFGISPEGIGTLGMFFNFIIAILVSRFTAPPSKEVQELTERIRTPRGSAASNASLH